MADDKLMKEAEQGYWYIVVRKYLEHVEDWRYLDEATIDFLIGTHNQDYITNEILYPVLKWRELESENDNGSNN
jgi:hypothetical protein